MSASGQSVFISYAREDLAATRRIADALSAFEVEVWFDQDGLEGGDQWDQKIRRQIKACSLFIPIISAQTQARREAYFRLEWKLAEERTHLMAEGTSFLLPIAIDDTAEAGALVPESFRRTQWTRLPRGVPNTPFVDRVRALLEKQRTPVGPAAVPDLAPAARARRKWLPAVLVIVLAVGASMPFWSRKNAAPPAAGAALPDKSAPADKSIAVLPFTNMSDDKENAFFADGIHEDVLTNLANIGDLRVISRTSVMQYRGTTKTVPEIAREMGVAYVLEGSVRRAGNTVRVTSQLIKAGTEEHVWAKSYDRDLKDVFAIQSALAVEITDTLKAVLSPRDKARLQHAPTTSAAAYELYLRAVEIRNRGGMGLEGYNRAQSLLQSAVELDPRFAAAWGELASVQLGIDRRSYDPTGGHLEQARLASETMERLAPDDPDTWIHLANYHATRADFNRSEQYIRRAVAALPNHSRALVQLGHLDKRQGRLADALAHYRRAYELDRQNPETRGSLEYWLLATRRYDEAAELAKKDPRDDGAALALLAFYARGSTREMEAWLAAHPSYDPDALMKWKFTTGDAAGFIRLADEARRNQPAGFLNGYQEGQYGCALMALGEVDRAKEVWTKILVRLRTGPRPAFAGVPVMLGFLGEKQQALAAFDEFIAERAKQAVNRDFVVDNTAKPVILAWVGERDQALAELARLLKVPAGLNVHEMRRSPHFKPLQGDARFEAILNDPANNAPLL